MKRRMKKASGSCFAIHCVFNASQVVAADTINVTSPDKQIPALGTKSNTASLPIQFSENKNGLEQVIVLDTAREELALAFVFYAYSLARCTGRSKLNTA